MPEVFHSPPVRLRRSPSMKAAPEAMSRISHRSAPCSWHRDPGGDRTRPRAREETRRAISWRGRQRPGPSVVSIRLAQVLADRTGAPRCHPLSSRRGLGVMGRLAGLQRRQTAGLIVSVERSNWLETATDLAFLSRRIFDGELIPRGRSDWPAGPWRGAGFPAQVFEAWEEGGHVQAYSGSGRSRRPESPNPRSVPRR